MQLSVIVPVMNEADNVAPLAREIFMALQDHCDFEVLFIDDGSTDATLTRLQGVKAELGSRLRILKHPRNAGQSAAIVSGARAAQGTWLATLDGDGQNDPNDIGKLFAQVQADGDPEPILLAGQRVRRQDSAGKLIASRIANQVRARLLHDDTPDTGCGLKVLPRELFLQLPYFDHMHRFLPALVLRAGGRVTSIPVNHRPRAAGQSKYGLSNRLWVGITDLLGVLWLQRRARLPRGVIEIQ